MNTVDKLTKETRILIDSAKDTVSTQLLEALKKNTVTVREDQVSTLISLIHLSLDQGYQKAIPVFQNSVKKHLT